MDELANVIQDVRYEGELLDPRPKPMRVMKALTPEEIQAKITQLRETKESQETDADIKTGVGPLDFESLMREYLGYFTVWSIYFIVVRNHNAKYSSSLISRQIKAYLKSLKDGTHVKLDFVEQIDVFQVSISMSIKY